MDDFVLIVTLANDWERIRLDCCDDLGERRHCDCSFKKVSAIEQSMSVHGFSYSLESQVWEFFL